MPKRRQRGSVVYERPSPAGYSSQTILTQPQENNFEARKRRQNSVQAQERKEMKRASYEMPIRPSIEIKEKEKQPQRKRLKRGYSAFQLLVLWFELYSSSLFEHVCNRSGRRRGCQEGKYMWRKPAENIRPSSQQHRLLAFSIVPTYMKE